MLRASNAIISTAALLVVTIAVASPRVYALESEYTGEIIYGEISPGGPAGLMIYVNPKDPSGYFEPKELNDETFTVLVLAEGQETPYKGDILYAGTGMPGPDGKYTGARLWALPNGFDVNRKYGVTVKRSGEPGEPKEIPVIEKNVNADINKAVQHLMKEAWLKPFAYEVTPAFDKGTQSGSTCGFAIGTSATGCPLGDKKWRFLVDHKGTFSLEGSSANAAGVYNFAAQFQYRSFWSTDNENPTITDVSPVGFFIKGAIESNQNTTFVDAVPEAGFLGYCYPGFGDITYAWERKCGLQRYPEPLYVLLTYARPDNISEGAAATTATRDVHNRAEAEIAWLFPVFNQVDLKPNVKWGTTFSDGGQYHFVDGKAIWYFDDTRKKGAYLGYQNGALPPTYEDAKGFFGGFIFEG